MAAGKAVAISAGTQPGDKVHPVVVEAMKELGIDISGNKHTCYWQPFRV